MGNCHFKTDFDTENITGKLPFKIKIPVITRTPNNERPRIHSKNQQSRSNYGPTKIPISHTNRNMTK